jgi:hypothetical protein
VRNLLFLLLSVFSFSSAAFSQAVKGVITDLNGEPLPYTTVQVFNSQLGTIANLNGEYFLALPAGEQLIYFQYLGYKTQKIAVTLGSTEKEINIKLEPQSYNLTEFTYKAGKEDAAYPIMRKAIALAKLHNISIENYQAKSYIKGSFTLTKIPWLMKKAIKDSDIKEGTTYVLEAVNEIKFQRPNKVEERVISSRSNLPPGTDPNIGYLKNNLYQPMSGDFISPLSPRAFSVYKFRYLGTFEDGENFVVKIEVTPKSKGPNVYTGYINLVEPSYAIHSLSLSFTDDQGIGYKMKQVMSPFNEIWMPVTQEFNFDMGIMGVKAEGVYVTSIRSYEVTPSEAFKKIPNKNKVSVEPSDAPEIPAEPLTKKQARKAVKQILEEEKEAMAERGENTEVVREYSYKVDSLAFQTPDSLWNTLRQVPLTTTELKGYQEADSIYLANKKTYEKDSIKALPRFKFSHILWGHYYNYGERTKERGYLKTLHFEGLAGGLNNWDIYNTVDGFVVKTGVHYTKKFRDFDSYSLGSTLRFAEARENLHGTVYFNRRYKEGNFRVTAGRMVYQINGQNPITNGVNLIYTLLAQQNFMKLYEKDFVKISGYKDLSTKVSVVGSAEFARRRALDNNSFNYIFNIDGRDFTSNQPENLKMEDTFFDTHNALLLRYKITWRPFARVSIYNDKEYVTNAYKPVFSFTNNLGFLDAPFNRVEASINQSIKVGGGNSIEYTLNGGGFIGQKPSVFIDFFHLNGNQTAFTTENSQFRDLNYYRYSTNQTFFQGFFIYNFRKLALSRITALKMMGVKESLFLNQALVSGATYTELGYRFIGIARAFGVDISGGFLNGNFNMVSTRFVVPF